MDQDLPDLPWGIAWLEAPPGWATFWHREMPPYLRVMVRTGLTPDGVAVEAVTVERTDGRALNARDLRDVRLPQPWMLARGRELAGPGGAPAVTAARPGARDKGGEHWRAVLRLLAEAERVAPRTPTKWMCQQWPYRVSDATMRRWVKKARERTANEGEDHT
jgi:hypothetical protein